MNTKINYYKVLQVDPSAEPEVIDAAFKRLQLKYHPDINKSPEATRKSQEINEAYDALKDPEKRRLYDISFNSGGWVNEPQQKSAPNPYDPPGQASTRQSYAENQYSEAEKRKEQERKQREEFEKQQAENYKREQERKAEEFRKEQEQKAQEASKEKAEQERINARTIKFSLIIGFCAIVGVIFLAILTAKKTPIEALISGDVTNKAGKPDSYSQFDVWVDNQSDQDIYAAFTATGQYDDGTTFTSINNTYSPFYGTKIPGKTKSDFKVYFDFDNPNSANVKIIDCSLTISKNINVGYSFNEKNQTSIPCSSFIKTPVPTSAPVVSPGEKPDFKIRYFQSDGDTRYLYELTPPDYATQTKINPLSSDFNSSYLIPSFQYDSVLFALEDSFGIMSTQGNNPQTIGSGENPNWVDENNISYINNDDDRKICIITLGKDIKKCITVNKDDNNDTISSAAFNPKFNILAYTMGNNLYFMDKDGKKSHNVLLYSESSCDSPSWVTWSSDGKELAFLSAEYDSYSLCAINKDETGLIYYQKVVASGIPTWSPDGKWILYAGYPWAASIRVISVDGQNDYEFLSTESSLEPFWVK